MKCSLVCAAGYATAAVLTFGYAGPRSCLGDLPSYRNRTECQVVAGGIAGTVWPLYWSWQVLRP